MQNPSYSDPSEYLESLRHVTPSRVTRKIIILFVNRIWMHLSESGKTAVKTAQKFLTGTCSDEERVMMVKQCRDDCIYVDGNSSATDRLKGFAAEAALCCLYGDDDYPTIPTYATNCAISAALATVEVILANLELQGHDELFCEKAMNAERRWQCEEILRSAKDE